MDFRGEDMAEKDEAKGHTKREFRIGSPDEALVVLWAREATIQRISLRDSSLA
jgi:hypothetical protein